MKPSDLGLSYEEALHGVQSAIKYKMASGADEGRTSDPKHLRVGIDSAHVSILAMTLLFSREGRLHSGRVS